MCGYRKDNKLFIFKKKRVSLFFLITMTSIKNINSVQKQIMADFMTEHPDLAKNRLSNCGQAKAVSNRLWETLTVKLNASGPPIKNAKMWRKVYSDQKFQIKKKLSFNKESKKRTGGGPYEELTLLSTEELILEAAGIGASVKGLHSVEQFPKKTSDNQKPTEEILKENQPEDYNSTKNKEDEHYEDVIVKAIKRPSSSETKVILLESNLKKIEESKLELSSKLDRLLEMKERSLKMKIEQHDAKMKRIKIDLEIKGIELDMLKKKQEMHNYGLTRI